MGRRGAGDAGFLFNAELSGSGLSKPSQAAVNGAQKHAAFSLAGLRGLISLS